MSEVNEFQNRMELLRTELQGRMSEFQSKLGELPAKVAEQLSQKIDAIFSDIDPEASPHAYRIKDAGTNVLDLIDGVVHAIAAIEKDIAARIKDS